MFDKNDEAYLIRAISQNSCLLFLGAGFSNDIRNKLGQNMPLGSALSRDLWSLLGYKEPFQERFGLQKVFQLVLNSGKPQEELRAFLEDRYIATDIPDKYDAIVKPYWYRIYTTNIDDSLGGIYHRCNGPRFNEIIYPDSVIPERDQFLDSVQCVYLHGKLPTTPDRLTFAIRQYARRADGYDRLYDTFVGDYSTCATVFVGTEFDEPIFFQYVEAREKRGEAAREHRPRSFLISPAVTSAMSDLLKDFNIIGYRARTEDFLEWLEKNNDALGTRLDILRMHLPTLESVKTETEGSGIGSNNLKEFSAAFHEVPTARLPVRDKSKYLLGSSPRWEDIQQNLDAPREVTAAVLEDVEKALDGIAPLTIIAMLGSAGCGKSTILRRLGLTLAQRGRTCYLTNCEDMPPIHVLTKVLEATKHKVVLLFDNAEGALGYASKLARIMKESKRPPVIVIASRTNSFYRKFGQLQIDVNIVEKPVPLLVRKEIEAVLTILERTGLLGKLRNLTHERRIHEFTTRAGKQILVAMREATEGEGFDKILRHEFSSLSSEEAKILYLCVGLATDAGYRLEKQEYVRCARVEPAVALDILDKDLNEIVLKTGAALNLLLLRHRHIAEFMVGRAAPREAVREAYKRLLPVLYSPAEGESNRRRARLYRSLINHQSLIERFQSNLDIPREIYEELVSYIGNDAQFWLQYGCYELQCGDLDFATNYLNQAEKLEPDNHFIINAKGQLLLKKGVLAATKEEASDFRRDGKALLIGNYNIFGRYDAHYYAILGEQEFSWIRKWCLDNKEKKGELEQLEEFIATGMKEYPRSQELIVLNDRVREEYLRIAVS